MAQRILVVEDEALAAMVLGEELEREGYEVVLAPDGLAALEMAGREPPGLLLTDLRMPRLDGRALIRRLRGERPDLPVVVMTGFAPPGGPEALRAEGEPPVLLLDKPIDIERLLEAVRALLR